MEGITKLRLLYLYKYLTEHTDERHTASTAQLISMLRENHQIDVNRVTLGNDIGMLIEAGFPVRVVRTRQNRYYYEGALFDEDELKMMAYAISIAPFISGDRGRALVDNLTKVSLRFDVTLSESKIISSAGACRDDGLYRKIETISDAITKKHRIRFRYIEYNASKKRVLKRDGEYYLVSPYAIVWNGDYFYVVGHSQKRNKIQHFRLDRLHGNPMLLEEESVPPPPGFNAETYAGTMFRMYGEKLTDVTLICANHVMNSLIDHFGIQVKARPLDDGHFTAKLQVQASPTFYRWVFGWGGDVKITGPENVAEEYREMCMRALE